jgi:hypothetical protein
MAEEKQKLTVHTIRNKGKNPRTFFDGQGEAFTVAPGQQVAKPLNDATITQVKAIAAVDEDNIEVYEGEPKEASSGKKASKEEGSEGSKTGGKGGDKGGTGSRSTAR